jgi:hypothetical protein
MELVYQITKVVSIVLFLYYGFACLFSGAMVQDFERFGLSRFRRMTGVLELLGGLGLLGGYLFPMLVVVAGTGLALLMLLGIVARLRVGDSLVQTTPALVLMVANAFVVVAHLT